MVWTSKVKAFGSFDVGWSFNKNDVLNFIFRFVDCTINKYRFVCLNTFFRGIEVECISVIGVSCWACVIGHMGFRAEGFGNLFLRHGKWKSQCIPCSRVKGAVEDNSCRSGDKSIIFFWLVKRYDIVSRFDISDREIIDI